MEEENLRKGLSAVRSNPGKGSARISEGRESWEGGLWISQCGQRLILDLGVRSSQITWREQFQWGAITSTIIVLISTSLSMFISLYI